MTETTATPNPAVIDIAFDGKSFHFRAPAHAVVIGCEFIRITLPEGIAGWEASSTATSETPPTAQYAAKPIEDAKSVKRVKPAAAPKPAASGPPPRAKGGAFMVQVAKSVDPRGQVSGRDCVSVAEVAKQLGLTPMTVYGMSFRERDPLPLRRLLPGTASHGQQKYGVLKQEAEKWLKRELTAKRQRDERKA